MIVPGPVGIFEKTRLFRKSSNRISRRQSQSVIQRTNVVLEVPEGRMCYAVLFCASLVLFGYYLPPTCHNDNELARNGTQRNGRSSILSFCFVDCHSVLGTPWNGSPPQNKRECAFAFVSVAVAMALGFLRRWVK